jgi:transposase-like protein
MIYKAAGLGGSHLRLGIANLQGSRKRALGFPQTVGQTCIVHLIRSSLASVSWKDRKAILPSIKVICRAENADMVLVSSMSRGRVEQTLSCDWPGLPRHPAQPAAWCRPTFSSLATGSRSTN